jgi:hypothetical protein
VRCAGGAREQPLFQREPCQSLQSSFHALIIPVSNLSDLTMFFGADLRFHDCSAEDFREYMSEG